MGEKISQRGKKATGFCLLVLVVMVGPIRAFSWWGLGVQECTTASNCPDNCAQYRDNGILTEVQAEICSDNSVPIKAIGVGVRGAIVDCQYKFRNFKWNCSTYFGDYLFGRFISTSHTRETAVINAYTVAGSIQAIAEACHEQRISACLCSFDGPPRAEVDGNVVFEDCKEDIDYGSTFISDFIGISSQDPSIESIVSIHNVEVGKRAVNHTEKSCICHGISGTCSVQTCHTKAPDISKIGELLRTNYSGAVKVIKDSSNNLVNAIEGRNKPTSNDLVYIDNSPNFCHEDSQNGVPGVEGRKCELTGDGKDACHNLCCDFGFHSVTFTVEEEKCTFVWCCRIECNIVSVRNVTEYRCNGPPSR